MTNWESFFAAIDEGEGERCPHGNLLPMPKTREQREAERKQFNRTFCMWYVIAQSMYFGALLAYLCTRGGR
jgi:hypothetical protein